MIWNQVIMPSMSDAHKEQHHGMFTIKPLKWGRDPSLTLRWSANHSCWKLPRSWCLCVKGWQTETCWEDCPKEKLKMQTSVCILRCGHSEVWSRCPICSVSLNDPPPWSPPTFTQTSSSGMVLCQVSFPPLSYSSKSCVTSSVKSFIFPTTVAFSSVVLSSSLTKRRFNFFLSPRLRTWLPSVPVFLCVRFQTARQQFWEMSFVFYIVTRSALPEFEEQNFAD